MRDIKAEAMDLIAQILRAQRQDIHTDRSRIEGLRMFEDVVIQEGATSEDIYDAAIKARDHVNNQPRWRFGLFGKGGSAYLDLFNSFIKNLENHFAEEKKAIDDLAAQEFQLSITQSDNNLGHPKPAWQFDEVVKNLAPIKKHMVSKNQVEEPLALYKEIALALHRLIDSYPDGTLKNIVHERLKHVSDRTSAPFEFNIQNLLRLRDEALRSKENEIRISRKDSSTITNVKSHLLEDLLKQYNKCCENKLLMTYFQERTQDVTNHQKARKSLDKSFENCLHNTIAATTTPRFT